MRNRVVIACLVLLCPILGLSQSCGLTDTILISENTSLSFPIDITDFFNDDLADPMQSLCGVEIDFLHQFSENLELTLTSPAGQSVNLIGPNSDDQFAFTFGTRWRISFVPCGETAEPDFPFDPQWNNEQAQNFANFNIYTGSYYPFNGCLEDFDTGPVNGQWTVSITNNPSEYQGAITFFRLIFCDSRGVECCFATPGEIQNENILACEGDTILDIEPQVAFLGGNADTSLYDYTFLFAQDSVFFDLDTLIDMTAFPAGNYQVCGFSYLTEELDSFPLPNGLLTIDSIYNNLNGLEPWLCAYMTDDCLDVTIVAPPDTTFLAPVICVGDSVQVGNQYFSVTGQYIENLVGYGGCDSIVVLNLTVQEVLLTALDSTICLGDSVTVDNSVYYSTGIYMDTLSSVNLGCDSIVTLDLTVLDPVFTDVNATICHEFGYEVGDSILTSAGYHEIILVAASGCDSIVRVNLTALTPEVIIAPTDTITCYNNQVLLDGSLSTPIGELQYRWWNLNGDLLSSSAQLPADTAGQYIFRIVQQQGPLLCWAVDTTTVVDHRVTPIADAGEPDTLNCMITEVSVGGIASSSGPEMMYEWSTTNGHFTGTLDSPFSTVDESGDYQLIVTNMLNGCQDTSSVTIAVDRLTPVADTGPTDTLTCEIESLELGEINTSQGEEMTYQWYENGILLPNAIGDSLLITINGLYELVVLNTTNFCADTSEVQIAIDTLYPIVNILDVEPLNCIETERQLSASFLPTDLNVNISWVANAGGVLAGNINSLSPLAQSAGNYQIEVENQSNGCSSDFEITVSDNSNIISAEPAIPDTLTCIESMVNLSAGNSTSGVDVVYEWHTVNGQFFADSIGPLTPVVGAGIYELIVRDTITLCSDTTEVLVLEDRNFPNIDAGLTNELNCELIIDTLTAVVPVMGDFTIEWTGPCVPEDSTTIAIAVDCPGWFYFSATDASNGCTSIDSVEVLQNIVPPITNIASPDTIDCNTATVVLNGITSEPAGQIDFLWTGPSILSTNTLSEIIVDTAGLYSLIVSRHDNFCSDTVSISVIDDLLPPVADVGQDTVLNCYFSTITLGGPNSSQGSEFSYQWYQDDLIIPDANADTLSVNESGTYLLVVLDQLSGCSDTSMIMVSEDFDQPPLVDAGPTMDISCLSPETMLFGDSTLFSDPVFPNWSGSCIVGPTDNWSITADCEGIYTLTVTNESNGCSRSNTTEVVLLSDAAVAVLPDTLLLSCDTGEGVIPTDGTSSGTYTWYLDDIEISLPFPNPGIDQIGVYELVVDNAGMTCADTAAVVVLLDCPPTSSIVLPDTINCAQQFVNLDGSASSSEGPTTFEWLLPEPGCAITPIDQNQINVICEGDYGLILHHNLSGQSDTSWVSVVIDTIPPIANANGNDTITCAHPVAILDGNLSSIGNEFVYAWTNGFEDTLSQTTLLETMEAGTYFLTVLDTTNACSSTDAAQVFFNNTVPVIAFGSEVFPCDMDSFGLQAFIAPISPSYNFTWQGPGILDNGDSLTVWIDQVGAYVFTAEHALTGCTATDTVEVVEQICVPCLAALPIDTLNCLVEEITIEAQFCLPCEGCTIEWQYESTIIAGANNLTLPANEPGQYILTATDTLGFTNMLVFDVVELNQTPIVEIGTDFFITCDSTSITLGTDETSIGAEYMYEWFTISEVLLLGDTPYFSTAVPDTFILQVTNLLSNCVIRDTTVVLVDTIYPVAEAGLNMEITCDDNLVVLDGEGSTLTGVTYNWIGPMAGCLQGSSSLTPIATCAGLYTLEVIGNNGCVSTDTVRVTTNTVFPEIIPFPDTSLTCAFPCVELVGTLPQTGNYDYRWCRLNALGEEETFGCALGALSYTVCDTGTYRFAVLDTETGCESYDVVNVVWDTLAPTVDAGLTDTLFCTLDSIQLHGLADPGNLVLWSSSNSANISDTTSLDPFVYEPDWYFLQITDSTNGCMAVDSVLIAQDEEVPQIMLTVNDLLDCETAEVNILGEAMTVSNLVEWQWSSPQGSFVGSINVPNVVVNDTAWYFAHVTDPTNGCQRTDSILVEGNFMLPQANIAGLADLEITCANDTLLLDATSSTAQTGADLNYTWQAFSPGQLFPDLTAPQVWTDRPANYLLVVEDQSNGCLDSLVFDIDLNNTHPNISLADNDTLNCFEPIKWIHALGSSSGVDFSYEWFDSDGLMISTTDSASVNQAGIYQLMITNIENGCSSQDSIFVEENFQAPTAAIFAPDAIDCTQPVVVLDGSASAQGSFFNYVWSAENGGILLGSGLGLVDSTSSSGTYLLTVFDERNGCDSIATVNIIAEGTPITGIDLLVESPPCFGDLYGAISIENIEGGSSPYNFMINGSAPTLSPFFEGLLIGEYEITVSDGQGCSFIEVVNLLPAEELLIDIGPDQEIKLGESATVEALVNQPFYDTLIWWPADLVNTPGAEIQNMSPIEMRHVIATVINSNGCAAMDTMRIFVVKDYSIFVPTLFSPNGDGNNDELTVFGGTEVVNIETLRIFDRWGNMVFERNDFQPNDPSLGWDGNFERQPMNTNVFVYYLEVSFADGTSQVISGDFVLMR